MFLYEEIRSKKFCH